MASKVNRRRFLRVRQRGLLLERLPGCGSALAAENRPHRHPCARCSDQARWLKLALSRLLRRSAKLIFACSGSADVGKIADLAARKLRRRASARCPAWQESAGE